MKIKKLPEAISTQKKQMEKSTTTEHCNSSLGFYIFERILMTLLTSLIVDSPASDAV